MNQSSDYNLSIATTIYALRKWKGATQNHLATLLSTERSVYSKKECGKIHITTALLKTIADMHQVSVASIYAVADTITQINFETMNLNQIVALFENKNPNEKENFTAEDLFAIFSYIKLHYNKISNTPNS